MTDRLRIAFYAPMKAPDHPTPSGDRHIARLTLQALARAGEGERNKGAEAVRAALDMVEVKRGLGFFPR